MSEVLRLARLAKSASREMLSLSSQQKNEMLLAIKEGLNTNVGLILEQNAKDIKAAREAGQSEALIDRLTLNEARVCAMGDELERLAGFFDPIGEITAGWRLANGMSVQKVRTPLGVIAMIYESRPNVTIEAASLALKSQNAIILRGSAMAKHSNTALCEIFVKSASMLGLPNGAVSLLADEDRASIIELAGADKFIDVIIPRGGVGLKEFIKSHSRVPVIYTGAGVCHTYVHKSADLKTALNVVKNAKTHRPSACNALECLVLDGAVAEEFLSSALAAMGEVEFYLPEGLFDKFKSLPNVSLASQNDYGVEFLSLKLAVRVVGGADEAIEFINSHGSGHSDAILASDYGVVERFLNSVDSAAVYANASTRFSDGGEFGFGGEIGIATQKLHARGPMGVLALTSEKYIVRGCGQVRG
ncbi:glutamate-5-semialdehyde dehydrogenase [Campylobacter sp. 19-13652]|uniref:glutamate-5-semialdehyde dehydrogenase n=1 Tax=Campylobacter sp. 19-13652 TaxID=2840180 RepID=UPI001C746DD6|nr:glutamate-5-semialdehyde dehydrogenase [Campylobacter sp. 19-13652]BCX78560.1 gamma-glutamyl phosphate reductase [Campylobacter sp. 19-13652]